VENKNLTFTLYNYFSSSFIDSLFICRFFSSIHVINTIISKSSHHYQHHRLSQPRVDPRLLLCTVSWYSRNISFFYIIFPYI